MTWTVTPTRGQPPRIDLLDAIDEAERKLTVLYSRWWDSVPAPLRLELHDIAAPLLRTLIIAGRR